MKINEAMRRKMAWEMVEEITSDAESLNPERDWKESHDAVIKIYEIAHSIRSPKCRKNHPAWCEQIDAAIRASKPSNRDNVSPIRARRRGRAK